MTRTPYAAAMLCRALLLACLVAVSLAPAAARAAEEILSLHADIVVNPDSSLEVTETITVRAEGDQIRRGIYRDFPTRYVEPSGLLRTAGFELLDTKRDGKGEPFRTESIGAGIRIYLGDANVFLRPGEYTYTIRYRTTRQLRFFERFDELYWNVTGNFWVFPINRASATVHLPEGAQIVQYSAYTGPLGSSASNARADTSGPGDITFETTRGLRAREGLTIALAWPKGFVAEPGAFSTFLRRLIDNIGMLIIGLGLIAVPAYFFWAWRRFGQDPPRGVIIPLFHPPRELTPAGVSYLYYKGFKKKRGVSRAFLAALVALAVRRHVTIEDDGGDITLERGPEPLDDDVGPGERRIYQSLLGSRQKIPFDKAHGRTVASAMAQFDGTIQGAFGRDRYFTHNYVLFFIGAILSAGILFAFIFNTVVSNPDAGFVVPFTAFSIFGAILLAAGFRRLRGSVPGGSYIVGGLALIAGIIVMAPLFLALFAFSGIGAFAPAVAAFLAIVNVAFFYLLPAPTVRGRKLMDQVEGFRMYLETAEKERMNLIGSPEMSVELFERFLPHAVGLDVERPWSDAYAAHLARTLPEAERGYQPSWYHGGRWDSSNIGRSTSAVASAVASGMSSAVPSSSGSSGSGGGGSSGGGGGGGGGGGW